MKKVLFLGINRKMTGLNFAISLVFIFLLKNINAQEILIKDSLRNNFQLLYEIDIEASYFTVDRLQNVYYVSKKNEVVKLNEKGEEQFRFINKTLGHPSYMDVTNPFNILLFYPDYQNVLTLDRTMNLAGQYNLFELGLFGINAVGMAGDGNIWVYDNLSFRLKKFNREGQVLVQSGDMSLELSGPILPKTIVEKYQKVYLNDPSKGIFVFDVFGKYLKTLPIRNVGEFQVIGNELLYFESGKMHSFHLSSFVFTQILVPEGVSEEDLLKIGKDRVYVLNAQTLRVYGY